MLNKKDLTTLQGLFMLYAVKKFDGKVIAAKNINTSIDTLNKYLEMLENELACKLISVSDRKCVLTNFGEKIYSSSEKIISCLKHIQNIKTEENAYKGSVNIACDKTIMYTLCSPVLNNFLDKYTDISLCVDAYDDFSHINKNDYDLCISFDYPTHENPIILFNKEVNFGFFVSQDYLINHSPPQSIEDIFLYHRLISKKDWIDILEKEFPHINKPSKATCLSNSNFIIHEFVLSGGGIGIMPISYTQNPNLVYLNNIECNIKSKVYLSSYKEVKDIPRIRAVIDFYKHTLQYL